MSHSRSVSPLPNGGWNAPGLIERGSTPSSLYAGVNSYSNNDDHWAAAKARSAQVRGYPSVQTKNEGFFLRSKRKISSTLPVFSPYTPLSANWKDPEKLGRSRWSPRGGGSLARIKTFAGNVLRRFKFLFIILSIVTLTTVILSQTNVLSRYRGNSHLGGGSKFVIILGANEGGGVMEWKGPREWAIERDSVRNKKRYTDRWGYILDIADMSTKKRFWWLDLNTFIMEPSISLQSHIFNNLDKNVYRDINVYNPLDITHPPITKFLDPVARSPTGDNLTSSIDIIIPQDCDGFNLGSFFVRRSPFTDRLLDLWWDPVLYEQKHMEWEHKEQDALEHLYASQPYLRTHFAFIPQRKINSFPPGACAAHLEQGQAAEDGKPLLDPRFHYNEHERDFMVNMAGCEWGRDCWAEMYMYRELSNRLNRSRWERFKDLVSDKWTYVMKTLFAEKAGPKTG
ncbi:hypothetical protein AYL99_02483 [Fonsecaea erecta]|uniref:Mannan polymerase II complex MNN10 subunit n=1 Tax=Fonsecaea erecta TaxID=1367422 RepID=A0A178ZUZ7_9EURO|nr:hypothetical protein AYL99_02483 [Fonsecaea erecta]OAP63256.1 hypothetical protein AYL99_02483 [Fonsecaea erecta]